MDDETFIPLAAKIRNIVAYLEAARMCEAGAAGDVDAAPVLGVGSSDTPGTTSPKAHTLREGRALLRASLDFENGCDGFSAQVPRGPVFNPSSLRRRTGVDGGGSEEKTGDA